jgi:hypothetical protein
MESLDEVQGRDWLGFVGIAPPLLPVISQEQQFAEKLHAYSLPRLDRVNTRTKDLIDMVLLIQRGRLDESRLAEAVKVTFARRATHGVPRRVEAPPAEWERVFAALARECGLHLTLAEGFGVVRDFVDKIVRK